MSTDKEEFNLLFGVRLRAERKRIDKTQDEMAQIFGVTVRTWGAYERGLSVPDAFMLAELYKNDLDIVYLLTGNKFPVGDLTEAEAIFISVLRKSSPQKRAALHEIISAFSVG